MPERPEYWGIKSKEFRKLKARLRIFTFKTFEKLKSYGFTKINSNEELLRYTVERNIGNQLIFVGFELLNESPRKYQLILRKWNKENRSQTTVDLYIREYESFDEFENSFTADLEVIINKIESITIPNGNTDTRASS